MILLFVLLLSQCAIACFAIYRAGKIQGRVDEIRHGKDFVDTESKSKE